MQEKQRIRSEVFRRRVALEDKAQRSRRILQRVIQCPQYRAAETVMFYLDARSEVRTRSTVSDQLETDRRVVVPYCVDERLQLFHLLSLDEVSPGAFGILEPSAACRRDVDRLVNVRDVDAFVVPGVAFDRLGRRLGHGHGFFDRLLSNARGDAVKIGVGFDCQIVEQLPSEEHDVRLDLVVTENAVWPEGGRGAAND